MTEPIYLRFLSNCSIKYRSLVDCLENTENQMMLSIDYVLEDHKQSYEVGIKDAVFLGITRSLLLIFSRKNEKGC